jgi:hypothetical protein
VAVLLRIAWRSVSDVVARVVAARAEPFSSTWDHVISPLRHSPLPAVDADRMGGSICCGGPASTRSHHPFASVQVLL